MVVSSTQQVVSSVVAHVDLAQRKLAWLVLNFLPAEHVAVEHNAWSVQQSATVLPIISYFAASLNLFVPQDTVEERHLVASSTQHVF
jgi:hypothetical protein